MGLLDFEASDLFGDETDFSEYTDDFEDSSGMDDFDFGGLDDSGGIDLGGIFDDVGASDVSTEPSYDWFDEEDDFLDFNSLEKLGFGTQSGSMATADDPDDPDGSGGISAGVWSKLLDFGLGSLGQWMKNKSTKKATTKKSGGGGGGGGGRVAPVTAVTKATSIGTRTKG